MNMVDKNGRLFGKINIVDFLIILLFIFIIPLLFHIYNILGKIPQGVPYNWIRVEAVTFTLPEFAELFKEGDISYDENKNPDGRVLKIFKKEDFYGNRLKSAISVNDKEEYRYKVPIFIEFELACTKSGKDEPWYYRREPIFPSTDRYFVFDTGRYIINCFLLRIEDPKER